MVKNLLYIFPGKIQDAGKNRSSVPFSFPSPSLLLPNIWLERLRWAERLRMISIEVSSVGYLVLVK